MSRQVELWKPVLFAPAFILLALLAACGGGSSSMSSTGSTPGSAPSSAPPGSTGNGSSAGGGSSSGSSGSSSGGSGTASGGSGGGSSGNGGGSGSSGGSSGGSGSSGGPMQLTLVAANAIQAGVTLPDAVWADANYVYLANFDGHLRVIDKHQGSFPIIGDVAASSTLSSVRGDSANVYATGNAGTLFHFSNQPPFSIRAAPTYGSTPLISLDVDQSSSIIVSQQQGQSAADANHVYLSALNSGDNAVAIDNSSGQVTVMYQENPVDQTSTAVFDRAGALVGKIHSPTDNRGNVAFTSIYSQGGVLALFTPGCCGRGVFLYDAATLAPLGSGSILDSWVDTVGVENNWLIVGTEGGIVDVFDISNRSAIQPSLAPVASMNLRTATGHTNPEDIEIRAIWTEPNGVGVRIYAGSSWGDAATMSQSYRDQLPTFFVIDLK